MSAKPVRPVEASSLPVFKLYPSRGKMLVCRVHRNIVDGDPEYLVDRYSMFITPEGWKKKKATALSLKEMSILVALEQNALNWCISQISEDEIYKLRLSEGRKTISGKKPAKP